MISGVATNLKSKLSQFNPNSSSSSASSGAGHVGSGGSQSSPNSEGSSYSPSRSLYVVGGTEMGSQFHQLPSAQPVIKRSSLGEQPASVIPLTVPGADASTMSSFPYGKK